MRMLAGSGDGSHNNLNQTYVISSYRAMGGKMMYDNNNPDRNSWAQAFTLIPQFGFPNPDPTYRGMFTWVGGVDNGSGGFTGGKLRPCKIRDITDGTSNTLAVGEYANLGDLHWRTKTSTVPGAYSVAMWANGYDWYTIGAAGTQPGAGARGLIPNYTRCGDLGQLNLCSSAFGSAHVGSTNFLKGDGSVISVSSNIDLATYGALATIAGGEVVGEF